MIRRGTKSRVMLLALLWAAAGASTARAEGPASVERVVVTATRTRARIDDVPSSIDIVTAPEIERADQALVSNSLRGLPGVDVTEFGSPGRSALVSIRGAAPDQVLTLIDGIEVNSVTVGQFDFANLATTGVDRIEVLRGSGGSLYGSQAIGGVINVLTAPGEGAPHLMGSGEIGLGPTHRETVTAGGESDRAALRGSLSFFGTDGFLSQNDDYRNLSTVWRGDLALLEKGTLTGIVRYAKSHTGLPYYNIAENRLDADAHARADFLLAKAEWRHSIFDSLTYRAAVGYVRDKQSFRDHTLEEEDDGGLENELTAQGRFASELLQSDLQIDYSWRELSLTTVGLEFKERTAHVSELDGEEESEDLRAPAGFAPDDEGETAEGELRANRSNVAVYLQEQLHLFDDRFQAIGGMRFDQIDQFGDHLTFSGSGAYLIRETHTRLRVGYQEGFRAPTFEELFEPDLGDPELEAEESWEVNAGITQELFDGRLRFQPTYFYRHVANLIEETVDELPRPIGGVPEGLGAENLDATFQGVEIAAAVRLLEWLAARVSYTYLDVGSKTGPLLNRPRHRGSLTISAEHGSLLTAGDHATGSLRVLGVGERNSADPFSTPQPFQPARLGGYVRTDLALSYSLAGDLAPLTFTASVRNLFNNQYEESIGFPAPPAWFLIGVRLAFSTDPFDAAGGA